MQKVSRDGAGALPLFEPEKSPTIGTRRVSVPPSKNFSAEERESVPPRLWFAERLVNVAARAKGTYS